MRPTQEGRDLVLFFRGLETHQRPWASIVFVIAVIFIIHIYALGRARLENPAAPHTAHQDSVKIKLCAWGFCRAKLLQSDSME